ncbi:conserved hypothetical protein [Culex quinquefasciatus]|uniref:Carbohydrate kinase PfkB domain-containing protein n=1 Tax=Culex quinquefasciatus TaxID=7176 RepID=B0WVP4_CULQU|nr:conserved hypothetical protein [Culex quinquefasciatus]|eukprot:XP_001861466.1 conserved hypothetical protein [Culex quinquefasciatus]
MRPIMVDLLQSINVLFVPFMGKNHLHVYLSTQNQILNKCLCVCLDLDGATYHANVNIAGGGVGRNIAEGIWKIYGDVRLVSAVGTDQNGDLIKRLLPDHCRTPVLTTADYPTANCSILLDNRGDCKLCVGDMSVHGAISVDWINSHRDLIRDAPLVVLDANVSPATMEAIFELCVQHEKPGECGII